MARWWHIFFIILTGVFLAGCDFIPAAERQLDEQKDPWFKKGRERHKQMDFKGAIEAFEKALEGNPKSASAHLELGLLHEQRESNFARAIYHYEKFLELRPDSPYAEVVRPHIVTCKQDLAKSVALPPLLQGEIQRLTTENAYLRQQIEIWRSQQPAKTNPVPAGLVVSRTNPVPTRTLPSTNRPTQTPVRQTSSLPRTHVVRTGDSIAKISRQYGVSEQAILSANRGVKPRNLKLGQVLVIPSR